MLMLVRARSSKIMGSFHETRLGDVLCAFYVLLAGIILCIRRSTCYGLFLSWSDCVQIH